MQIDSFFVPVNRPPQSFASFGVAIVVVVSKL